jgi:hypothetical protein
MYKKTRHREARLCEKCINDALLGTTLPGKQRFFLKIKYTPKKVRPREARLCEKCISDALLGETIIGKLRFFFKIKYTLKKVRKHLDLLKKYYILIYN